MEEGESRELSATKEGVSRMGENKTRRKSVSWQKEASMLERMNKSRPRRVIAGRRDVKRRRAKEVTVGSWLTMWQLLLGAFLV